MKKAVFALAAVAAMSFCVATTPAWSAGTACKSPVPNLFGVANVAALHRVTTVTRKFSHKHFKGEHVSHHFRWNWGQYVGTSIAAAAVGEITQAVMTPCRQLTLSEAYQNAAGAFLPFVGSWAVELLMPDNARTYEIARLAKEGKLTQEQALQAYVEAYRSGGH